MEGAIFEQKGRAGQRVCRNKALRCPPRVTESHVAWTEAEPGYEVKIALRKGDQALRWQDWGWGWG